MNWLKELMLTVLVAGAVIWVPCLIGAVCWAVRYTRRNGKMAHDVRRYRDEEVIYE